MTLPTTPPAEMERNIEEMHQLVKSNWTNGFHESHPDCEECEGSWCGEGVCPKCNSHDCSYHGCLREDRPAFWIGMLSLALSYIRHLEARNIELEREVEMLNKELMGMDDPSNSPSY